MLSGYPQRKWGGIQVALLSHLKLAQEVATQVNSSQRPHQREKDLLLSDRRSIPARVLKEGSDKTPSWCSWILVELPPGFPDISG